MLFFFDDPLNYVTECNFWDSLDKHISSLLVFSQGQHLIQVKTKDNEEFESLDITNMPKNIFTLKREILKTLGISHAQTGE